MAWLIPSVIATLCGTTLLTGVFAYLYATYRHSHLRLWAWSWGAYALRLGAMLVMLSTGEQPALLFANQALSLLGGTLLLAGTLSFIGKKTPWLWWAATLVGIVYIAAAIALKYSFMALALPTFTFLAAVTLWSGVAILRNAPARGLGSTVTGWALVLWGLHKANYPWLRSVEWFAPWGYLIASVLAFVVALGFLVTYLEALRSEQSAAAESYRALIEAAPYGIGIADPSTGILLSVNSALAEMVGRPAAELVGQPQRILHPEADHDGDGRTRTFKRQVAHELGNTLAAQVVTKDGVVKDVEIKSAFAVVAGREVVQGFFSDVTEKRKAENAIRHQRYLLESSQAMGHIGTWEFDLAENRLVWTDENCRIFGVPEGSVVHYETFLERVHPEDRAVVNQAWTAATEGKPYDIEHRVLLGGAVKWVREKADLTFNADGKAVRAVGFTQDITGQKTLAEEVRKEDLKYRRFLTSTRTAPWEIDLATGEFTFVGQQMVELFGYPLSYWKDMASWSQVVHPEDREWASNFCAYESKEGRDHDFTYRAIHADGRILWIQDVVSVVQGPRGPEKLVGFMHDVTRREEAVRALRESEERFQKLFNEAPLAYQSLDVDGRLLEVNDRWLQSLGYTRDEVIGHSFAEFLDPEFTDRFQKGFPKFKTRGEVHGIEHVMRKKTGERMIVAFEGKVTYREDGSMLQTHCILNDITRAKANEEERQRLEIQLRQAQKLESIGTLAGGIAHDFNNILGAVLGFTELTLMDTQLAPEARENLQEVLSAARRAKELVTQILTFSRKGREAREPVQMHLVVGEAMRLLRQTIPTTIAISLDITKEQDTVLADPTQLHQIVMNLCTNAYHAMHEGGGTLSVALTATEIDGVTAQAIPGLSPGPYVRLSVADTGTGMAPETLAKVFEPFFTTKPTGQGTGLGMSVVHGIIQTHGGAIAIDSALGRGTCIDVYLPTHSSERAEPKRALIALPTGDERLMVVDDEPILAKMIAKMLQGLGYTVEHFSSSREALARFRQQPDAFALVLTDQTMPEMTGATLAQALLEERADLPVIICTGYSETLNEAKVRAIGVRALLPKPIEKALLARIVREAIDG